MSMYSSIFLFFLVILSVHEVRRLSSQEASHEYPAPHHHHVCRWQMLNDRIESSVHFADMEIITQIPTLTLEPPFHCFQMDHSTHDIGVAIWAAGDDSDKKNFYWLFDPNTGIMPIGDIPLVLWLNGSPACSSMVVCGWKLVPSDWSLGTVNGQLMWTLKLAYCTCVEYICWSTSGLSALRHHVRLHQLSSSISYYSEFYCTNHLP